MKSLIILLLFAFAATTTFAQKAKAFQNKTSTVIYYYYSASHDTNKSGRLSPKEQMKLGQLNTPAKTNRIVINSPHYNCPGCWSEPIVTRIGSKQAIKSYKCSMHTGFVSTKGRCPLCNATLTEVKKSSS